MIFSMSSSNDLSDSDPWMSIDCSAQAWQLDLLESVSDPIVRFGRDLQITDANPPARRLGLEPGARLACAGDCETTLRGEAMTAVACDGTWQGELILLGPGATPIAAAVVLVDCGDGGFAALVRKAPMPQAGEGPPDDMERPDLEGALDRDELTLFYQPKVSLLTGEVIGFEALARWQHPERGLILPGSFIPYAEATGLIRPMGLWALEEASRQSCEWNAAQPAGKTLFMAVNVSALQLTAPGLVESVGEILVRTGVDPSTIVLEITESVVAERTEETMQTLARLRTLGLRLAIDDFGSGYSSLQYIKAFNADILKIDRAFVADLVNDQQDWEIINAIVALAHAMGMRVVAEGVETGEQAGALRTLGADYAQGYHFSRPVPPQELESLLVDGPPWMLSAPITV